MEFDNQKGNIYDVLAAMITAFQTENIKQNAAQIDKIANLENRIAQPQDTSFLPLTMEGEGKMTQVKDRLTVGVYPDGKPIVVWVSGKDKATFYDNLVRTYAEYGMLERLGIQLAKPVMPVQKQETKPVMPTFKEYAERWFESKKPSLRMYTQQSYQTVLTAHMIPFFGSLRMDAIDRNTVQEYFNTRKKPNGEMMTEGSLQTHKQILSVILKTALDDEIINRNPLTSSISNPGRETPRKKALTRQEVEEVYESLKDMSDTKDARFTAIGLLAGLRRGEILGLQWKHIDMKNGLIHIVQQVEFTADYKSVITPPKTENGIRDVYIDERLIPYLKNPGKPDEYIISGEKPYNRAESEWMWKRIEKHLSLNRHITSHILRHSFITTSLQADVLLFDVQVMAGHADSKTTQRYYTPTTEAIQHAKQKVQNRRKILIA